jgi:hypothetical protein
MGSTFPTKWGAKELLGVSQAQSLNIPVLCVPVDLMTFSWGQKVPDHSRFRQKELLGSGGFADVYRQEPWYVMVVRDVEAATGTTGSTAFSVTNITYTTCKVSKSSCRSKEN